jgi:hypothetical protein
MSTILIGQAVLCVLSKRSHMTPQQKINYWQGKFRLLQDWKIDYREDGSDGDLFGQCSHNADRKVGAIYPFGDESEPEDYFFHEILHMAICASQLNNLDLPYQVRRKNEEILVQDLSQILIQTHAPL